MQDEWEVLEVEVGMTVEEVKLILDEVEMTIEVSVDAEEFVRMYVSKNKNQFKCLMVQFI